MAFPEIAAFARSANTNDLFPKRIIAGAATKISRAVHDIQYDAVHDEIVIANVFAQAILTYRGGADGEEAPIRVIQGPKTQLQSTTWGMDVDPVHNELFIAEPGSIQVFPRTADGDVAPIRVIQGQDTQISWEARVRGLSVDPVNNVLVLSSQMPGRGSRILIFDRTANGNTAPLRVIEGPRAGFQGPISHLRVYPAKGWIVTVLGRGSEQEDGGEGGSGPGEGVRGIAVWSIHDNGNVPPRWLLGGAKSNIRGSRLTLALNPNAKEVLVGSGQAVEIYSFPEIF